jgi:outer membrane immunogenic protein
LRAGYNGVVVLKFFFNGEDPMRRQILLASVGAIAIAGTAFAAEPAPTPPPPVPIFTWTGIYAGGQIGYAWGRDDTDITTLNPAAPFFTADTRPEGVIGGAHLGYNLQVAQWVIGLEGTVDGTSLDKTVTLGGVPVFTVQGREDVQGSILGRLGFAFDRVLIYATGGAAFSNVKDDYRLGAPFFLADSITKTRTGWTVGGGFDYAITNNWSIGAQYRYSDFGHFNDFVLAESAPFAAVPFTSAPIARHHLTENQIQAVFSYKFTPFVAPVVAKY